MCVTRLGLRPLQPVRHAHLAVHRRGRGEVLLGGPVLADATVQRAESEMAVRDERTHGALFGERERFAVPCFAGRRVEAIRVTVDVAEQM